MTKRTIILAHATARATAHRAIDEAPAGHVVTITEPTKRRIQEEKYHAMIGDIARQTTYAGKRWDADDMKRILVDEFAEEMRINGEPLHHDSRVVPSENGRRVIQLGCQTKEFRVKEAAAFIDWLYAWGADRDVRWSEPGLYRPEPVEALA